MTDEEFRAYPIAKYQADQGRDRQVIAWIDAGGRHFDQAPGATGMVDSTDKVRAGRVAHIKMLEELVQMWSQSAG